jgi:copper transport protein
VVRAGRRTILLRGAALGALIASLFGENRRRSLGVAAIASCLALSPVTAYAHATLLRSTPAANSDLAKPPESIRLVFSEAIVAELSQISLVGADGQLIRLRVATDPHDVHTLIGSVGTLPSGRYKVVWHVLSADGHPVGGTFPFTVVSGSDATAGHPALGISASDSLGRDTSSTENSTTEVRTTPVLASVLRGAGLGAMMAAVGLLFLGVTRGARLTSLPRALIVRLIAVGAILLAAHMIAWLLEISSTGSLSMDLIGTVLASMPGKLEAIRVALALLALWAIALARRPALALMIGACCLLVSGAIGHPAAIHPAWSIPLKALHLLAGAAWLGGLLWLVAVVRRDDADFPIEARRVSSIALVCAIAIFLSGTLQTATFLNSPGDLLHSTYGRLALIKMMGLIMLIGFGAFNRFILLPVSGDASVRPALSRSVRQEIVIMIALILVGGFLAYVPTPPVPRSAAVYPLTGTSP